MEVSSEKLISEANLLEIGFVAVILVPGELLLTRGQCLIRDRELNLSGNSFSTLWAFYPIMV